MAHRIFSDSSGTSWLVLAVYPTLTERRSHADRRSTPHAPVSKQRRVNVRRQIVRRGMGKGWLVFKAPGTRRRLAPITKNWETCSVAELEALLGRSKKARRAGDPVESR